MRPKTPAVTLLLLAPLVGEVLNGATRLSFIFAFVPQIMVWGCGVLLIREAAHRWKAGWPSVILLGLALSTIVEVLVLQTSVAPLPWLQMASIPVYDRVWGVNWLWFVFMLGYETVWIVLVPILLTELRFPARRHDAWIGTRGLTIAAIVFLVGCVGLWALWTQSAMPVAFKQPKYWPPRSTLLLGAAGTLALVGAAYAARGLASRTSLSRAPSPWIAGVAAVALSVPWWFLIVLVFAPMPSVPFWIAVLAAPFWALAACLVFARWSASPAWTDRHRWALAFGALLVCMLLGYLGSSLWPRIDLVAKIVLNAIAAALMVSLGRTVWRRTSP
jgi:hypothetical protein